MRPHVSQLSSGYTRRVVRFGVQAAQSGLTWPELVEAWKVLDESGFDTAFTNDHLMAGFRDAGGGSSPYFEGWTALAGLAALTRRITTGIQVSGVTYRHPSLVAKMAVTVDHIAGGRFILGMGAAWHQGEHVAFGIPFPPIGERMDRLEEALQALRLLFAGGKCNFDGRYYQLKDAICDPLPLQKPGPPIMVAGAGEKRTLRISAQYADIINVLGTPETVRHKIAVLHRHCQDVGREPAEIEVSVDLPYIMTSRGEADAARHALASRLGANVHIPPEDLYGGLLVGDPRDMHGQIEALLEAGVQHVILQPMPRAEPGPLAAFAEHVIPRFR
jgi:F420-dependent oxidoreductase-like protein